MSTDSPYTHHLASGAKAHELEPHFFELPLLEQWWYDGRYHVRFSEFHIRIYPTDRHWETLTEDERFEIRAGIGWCDSLTTRSLCVFLIDLSRLPAKMQRLFTQYEIKDDCKMDPDFFTTHIEGKPPEHVSAYSAVLEIMAEINRMHEEVTGSRVFSDDYTEVRPREFSVFNLPTRKSFETFVEISNKMFIDNVNSAAFPGIEKTQEIVVDGRPSTQQKGTITLWVEWLAEQTDPNHPSVTQLNDELREIRKRRSKASHTISDAEFDPAFFEEQRRQINAIYESFRAVYLLYAQEIMNDAPEPFWWFDRPVRTT